LFRDVLKFDVVEVEPRYYADGEDAYAMRRSLVQFAKDHQIEPFDKENFFKEKPEKKNGKSKSKD
jgi:peptide alpha-N-acetyltransferase